MVGICSIICALLGMSGISIIKEIENIWNYVKNIFFSRGPPTDPVANELIENELHQNEAVENRNEDNGLDEIISAQEDQLGENDRVENEFVAKDPLDLVYSVQEISDNEHLREVICVAPISASRSTESSFSVIIHREPQLLEIVYV